MIDYQEAIIAYPSQQKTALSVLNKIPAYYAERFWSKVDKTPGQGPHGKCWLWTGGKTPYGYGIFLIDGVQVLTHRIAFTLGNGYPPPPDKPCVCHACDTPACCNPDCLWPGTLADNLADARAKGRWKPRSLSMGS